MKISISTAAVSAFPRIFAIADALKLSISGTLSILDVSPNTIYYWEKKLYGDITRKVGTVTVTRTNHIAKPHITGVNLHVPGKGNITLDHELLTNISRLAGFTS